MNMFSQGNGQLIKNKWKRFLRFKYGFVNIIVFLKLLESKHNFRINESGSEE